MGGEGLDESSAKAYSPRMSSYTSAGMASYTSNMMPPPQEQQHQQQQQQQPYVSSAPPVGTCLICYHQQVDVMLEPCHHQFHAGCIEQWQTKDKVCPTCWTPTQNLRRLMPPQYTPMRGGGGGDYSAPPGGQKLQQQQHGHQPMMDPATPSSATAAMVSDMSMGGGAGTTPSAASSAMRKGKWTAEESAYCDRLIEEFKKGNLPLAEGTTLRTFLSKLLNCDPMRISKKYTGDQCIGKIIFRRREDEISKEDMETIRKELAELEKTYLEREQYNQRRREKRLESELSRDKNRFMAARTMGYNSNGNAPPAAAARPSQQQQAVSVAASSAPPAPHYPQPTHYQQQQQQQQQASSRVPPPRHPLQAPPSSSSSSHLFNTDSNNISILGIAGSQQQRSDIQADANHSSSGGTSNNNSISTSSSATSGSQQQQSDSFPRVSSIDSFSCLFPRVASIENFQMASHSSGGPLHHQSGFGGLSSVTSSSGPVSGYGDTSSSGMVKNMSIGESLNSYIPRIQSLEQLSHLLQEHAPPSPRSANASASAGRESENSSSNDFSGRGIVDKRRAAEMQSKESGDGDSIGQLTGTKRLSPNGSHPGSSMSGNQIQIPKPLSKMPRSSSGIFPRVPSMDKLPRVPSLDKLARVPSMDKLSHVASLDKLPRVTSLDKLPRIPSMDKLHNAQSMERIPRVPSTDKLPRVPSLDKLARVSSSSDMFSRFGSSDHLSSFPSFSNLSGLSASPSFDKLSTLGGLKSGFPRNSSIEDILSLVASSENSGVPSGSHLQLSALAAVAGEESSHLAAAAAAATDRKRRMESSSGASGSPLVETKKSRLSA